MNPMMIIFFMFYNFIMPKVPILFIAFYFFYAYIKEHFIYELNTWFGLIISIVFAIAFHFFISDKIFQITYKRFMNKVSDVEPFVAFISSIFILSIFSIILGVDFLDYIISLRIF